MDLLFLTLYHCTYVLHAVPVIFVMAKSYYWPIVMSCKLTLRTADSCGTKISLSNYFIGWSDSYRWYLVSLASVTAPPLIHPCGNTRSSWRGSPLEEVSAMLRIDVIALLTRACRRRVIVVSLCVCVCVSVCLSVCQWMVKYLLKLDGGFNTLVLSLLHIIYLASSQLYWLVCVTLIW